MDTPEIMLVYNKMDEKTRAFLPEFLARLRKQYPADVSIRYLNKMSEYLETYFNDVLLELNTERTVCEEKIADELEKAKKLKKALNTDFDIRTNDNDELPLTEYLAQLKIDLEEFEELFNRRREEVENCIEEQRLLCEALEEPLRPLSLDPLATELELSIFQEHLTNLKSEKRRRSKEIDCLKEEIEAICTELDVTVSESVNESFTPTMEHLDKLRNELTELRQRRENIKRDCDQMLNELESLWNCLEVDSSVRERYRELAAIYRQSALDDIKDELKRCKVLKRENVKLFVNKLRQQIVAAWDQIHRSQRERDGFTYFHSELYTEDLLSLHEYELAACQKFYEENRAIFEKFAERNAWFERWLALEAKKTDPNRYNNRGGQLLREEKERNKLNSNLPKIEAEITAMVDEYRVENNGREFLINGEPIIKVMERQWDEERNMREQQKSARKVNGQTPSGSRVRTATATTPKTPMSLRAQTTLKRFPSNNNLASTCGNTGKKLLLDIPGRPYNVTSASITKGMNATNAIRTPLSKRNLFDNTNSTNKFARPTSAVKQMRAKTVKTMATLRVPTLSLPRRRSNGIANISASRIVKKYRRSNAKRLSRTITSDESLVNYDAFAIQMKSSSQCTNSSVVI